jgi:hypothetical protein
MHVNPKVVAFICVLAFLTGVVAATYWYRSSTVAVEPQVDHRTGGAMPGPVRRWLGGMLIAAEDSATLNKKASVWTAATVVLGTLSNLVGLTACGQ